jgi:hypothetical protein
MSRLTLKQPPTTVCGELAMTPAKNRVIMIVCIFVAVAVAAEKQAKINMGRSMVIRLPYISDNGPKTGVAEDMKVQTRKNGWYHK